MDVAEKYSILYEKKHGRKAYIRKNELNGRTDFNDGLFSREFVVGFIEAWIEAKDNFKQPTSKDVVDVALVEANFAAMLLELKKIATDAEKASVKL